MPVAKKETAILHKRNTLPIFAFTRPLALIDIIIITHNMKIKHWTRRHPLDLVQSGVRRLFHFLLLRRSLRVSLLIFPLTIVFLQVLQFFKHPLYYYY